MIIKLPDFNKCNIAIFGLGYVGLPLAIEFARCKISVKTKNKTRYKVFAYDINPNRINELNNSYDKNNELKSSYLKKSGDIIFTSDLSILETADVFIVTVPTPIDGNKHPDLSPLIDASKTIGKIIKKRKIKNQTPSIIIFESTVYPGATEEVCNKIIEKSSGLLFNLDYFLGYSPERINPGDKKKTLKTIIKVTSGSNEEVAHWINEFYSNIITSGTHLASSIKVAEAAKIIENTQRDINIALMNELSIIFNKLNLSSKEILEAAGTKWNFSRFKPGLVGGHCIGVDPYYLTYKSIQIGYKPQLILSGRKINDGMPDYIVTEFIKLAVKKKIIKIASKVLVMGITFKANCNDMRNSKAIEIVNKLIDYELDVDIYDPLVKVLPESIINGSELIKDLKNKQYLGIIIAVDHEDFKKFELDFLRNICMKNSIIFDVNNIYPHKLTDLRL